MQLKLDGKRVLVTGGAGFIGSHTVDAVVAAASKKTIVDMVSTGRRENLNSAATFYEMSLADERIEEIMAEERPEVIYHFAYFVKVPESLKNPMLDMDVLRGSVQMLQSAVAIGTRRVVFSSSGFLYGNTLELPASEELALDPITPYVVTKQAL